MSYERNDFAALQERRAEETTKTPRQTKRRAFIERADIRLSALTNDHNWNEYLSMVEAEVATARDELKTYQEVLHNPFVLDDLRVRAAKMGVALCNERIRALEWAINIPKSIHDEVTTPDELAKIAQPDVTGRSPGNPPAGS